MEETHFYSGLKKIGNFQKSNEVCDMGYKQYCKFLSYHTPCPYVVQLGQFPSSILVSGSLRVFVE